MSDDDTKLGLRKVVRQRLREMVAADRNDESRSACEQLHSVPEVSSARVVLAYLAMPSELDVSPLIERLLTAGVRVAVPRVDWQADRMTLAEITSLEGLQPGGRPGLFEPPTEARGIEPGEVEAAAIPGLAFDRTGGRLGRGGGFYDRLLPDVACVRIGVCFDRQLVDRVPVEGHDVRVGVVVTGSGVFRAGDEGLQREAVSSD